MAQILKKEVKQRILQTALESFIRDGYKNTSMKSISKASNISVGNIYNYFKDKEALYDTLVLPVFNQINELFKHPPKYLVDNVDGKIEAFIEIYKSNKEVFVMLIENSENTKFENLKMTIINNFAAAINIYRATVVKTPATLESDIFIKAFASAFVTGIIVVLTQATDEELKLKVLYKFLSSMKKSLLQNFSENEVNYEKTNL